MNRPKTLKIEWQRLVIDKSTCPRCGGTEQELEKAVRALGGMGIKVELIKKMISESAFKKDPQASNRILIGGRPLEYWLGAATGKSPCCSSCGDNECRTVDVGGSVYETIPSDLIVSAALKAARKK